MFFSYILMTDWDGWSQTVSCRILFKYYFLLLTWHLWYSYLTSQIVNLTTRIRMKMKTSQNFFKTKIKRDQLQSKISIFGEDLKNIAQFYKILWDTHLNLTVVRCPFLLRSVYISVILPPTSYPASCPQHIYQILRDWSTYTAKWAIKLKCFTLYKTPQHQAKMFLKQH